MRQHTIIHSPKAMPKWPVPIVSSVGVDYFQIKINHRRLLFIFLLLWIGLGLGCSAFWGRKAPEEGDLPLQQWGNYDYSQFLQQNMKMINEKYTTDYELQEFVVDTDTGSTLIQNLIAPEVAALIVEQIRVKDLEDKDQILNIYDYLIEEYDYVLDANHWPTVEETVKTKKGDCKGLSMLLMSLWLSAGFDAYVAISNGHMWANVHYDNRWHLFEVDKDIERKKIYNLPGFYQYPLYKIFKDQTYKRKRKQVREPVPRSPQLSSRKLQLRLRTLIASFVHENSQI